MKTVSAATANRQFSALLREVALGERVTVLSRGKPVAAMVPVATEDLRGLGATVRPTTRRS